MTAMSYRYVLHGLRLVTDIALCDLSAGDPADEPDVVVRSCPVPLQLPGEVARHGHCQWDGRQLLLSIPRVARFLVTAGSEIRVDAEPGADTGRVAVFLLGSAWAACCQQRGLLLLHASAVQIGNVCCVFMGRSGHGKSTLAALLAARGHSVLADDTCVLAVYDGAVRLQPAQPRVKLWSDALAALPASAGTVRPAAGRPGKFIVSMGECWQHEPLLVSCMLQLDDDRNGAAPGFVQLAPLAAIQAITANTFRPTLIRLLGLQQQNFALGTAVAANLEVHRWIRPWGRHRHPEMVAMLECWAQRHDDIAATRVMDAICSALDERADLQL